jgi:hypothetical protein
MRHHPGYAGLPAGGPPSLVAGPPPGAGTLSDHSRFPIILRKRDGMIRTTTLPFASSRWNSSTLRELLGEGGLQIRRHVDLSGVVILRHPRVAGKRPLLAVQVCPRSSGRISQRAPAIPLSDAA